MRPKDADPNTRTPTLFRPPHKPEGKLYRVLFFERTLRETYRDVLSSCLARLARFADRRTARR